MSYLKKIIENKNSSILLVIVTNFLILSTFFFLTLNKSFFGDDWSQIISLKLYHLIHGHIVWSAIFNELHGYHYAPVWRIVNTFFSDDSLVFHLQIIICLFISSIIVFFITYEITKDNLLSVLASFFFCLNFSTHINSLSWSVLHAPITNSVTGFLSVYFFLLWRIKKKILIFLIYFTL